MRTCANLGERSNSKLLRERRRTNFTMYQVAVRRPEIHIWHSTQLPKILKNLNLEIELTFDTKNGDVRDPSK